MRVLDAGVAGAPSPLSPPVAWDEIGLAPLWRAVVDVLAPGTAPRPVQAVALRDHRILESRRNLIVAAPTNSGKTLLAWLLLLTAVRRRRRALYIVPMRAIAREKGDEIERVAAELGSLLDAPLTVTVSTGDYAIEEETLASPPPDTGELIIATPERVEAIFRNARYAGWLATIDVVCVDEAHLISVPRRGPTLEHVVTSFLTLPAPPRVALLSATVGATDAAERWLAPCDLIRTTERQPPLRKQVVALAAGEEKGEVLLDLARTILGEPGHSLLVFVYQTRSAEATARRIAELLAADRPDGAPPAQAYHAQMSPTARQAVLAAYASGETRCLVTTTSLALGVNLPATHVVVRDITFPGVGSLSSGDILQMMGRAGRGERDGVAYALAALGDGWPAEELAAALHREEVGTLQSALDGEARAGDWNRRDANVPAVAGVVAGILTRRGETGATQAELAAYLARSLGGHALATSVTPALAWLTDPFRLLAYAGDEGRYHLTVLGTGATRSFLPLEFATGFAQLMRDLLTVDPADGLLGRWRPLDTLIVLNLLHDRTPHLRAYSAALDDQVQGWVERSPEHASMLYAGWIRGAAHASYAEELLGSLGIESRSGRKGSAPTAHRLAIQAMLGAIVLFERSRGRAVAEVQREWRVQNLEGVEARWRDDSLWLLSGLEELLEIRTFYYHLREHCDASPERVQRVKRMLGTMRFQSYGLRDALKYCSPLGSLLVSLRTQYAHGDGRVIGHGTMRRLEAAGYTSAADLVQASVDDLVRCGVQRKFARQIHAHLRRRAQ